MNAQLKQVMLDQNGHLGTAMNDLIPGINKLPRKKINPTDMTRVTRLVERIARESDIVDEAVLELGSALVKWASFFLWYQKEHKDQPLDVAEAQAAATAAAVGIDISGLTSRVADAMGGLMDITMSAEREKRAMDAEQES